MTAYFEEVPIGVWREMGRHTFGAEEIKAFARLYDPQACHVDEAAAKESFFGALTASGWHTAAIWMKLMVALETADVAAAHARGERPALFGPSPGFKKLRWLKPVYAGDTLSYRVRALGRIDSRSKPQWGLVETESEADNQHGETVFSFLGFVFVERRQPFTGKKPSA